MRRDRAGSLTGDLTERDLPTDRHGGDGERRR
jgi:hypothetical protein